ARCIPDDIIPTTCPILPLIIPWILRKVDAMRDDILPIELATKLVTVWNPLETMPVILPIDELTTPWIAEKSPVTIILSNSKAPLEAVVTPDHPISAAFTNPFIAICTVVTSPVNAVDTILLIASVVVSIILFIMSQEFSVVFTIESQAPLKSPSKTLKNTSMIPRITSVANITTSEIKSHAVSVMSFIISHAVSITGRIVSITSSIVSLIDSHVSVVIRTISSPFSSHHSSMRVHPSSIRSATASIIVDTPSCIAPNAALPITRNLSDVLYAHTSAPTNATNAPISTPIAATTATIGQDNAPTAAVIAPNPATIDGINPTNRRNIPANIEPTDVIAAKTAIAALTGPGILLNTPINSVSPCAKNRITGSNAVPIDISISSKAEFSCSRSPFRLSFIIFDNLSTAPSIPRISLSSSLTAPEPSWAIALNPFNACSPKIVDNAASLCSSLIPDVASIKSSTTSVISRI